MSLLCCNLCNTAIAKLCEGCQSSIYCSTVCQEADWPIHKIHRTPSKSISKRPDALHKLGVFCPFNGKTPRLIWIHCKTQVDEAENLGCQKAGISHLLGEDFLGIVFITHNERLEQTPCRCHRHLFLPDGSEPTQSIIQTSCKNHGAAFMIVGDQSWRSRAPVAIRVSMSTSPLQKCAICPITSRPTETTQSTIGQPALPEVGTVVLFKVQNSAVNGAKT